MAGAMKRFFPNRMADYTFDENPLVQLQSSKDLLKRKTLEIMNKIFDRQRTTVHEIDGGLYVGITGVAYMCYYIGNLPTFSSYKADWMEKAEDYINKVTAYIEHPRYRGDKSLHASWLLGNAGIYATTALIMNELGEKQKCETYLTSYAGIACNILPLSFLKHGSDELFVGRAGYICGALTLNKAFQKEVVPLEYIHEVCKSIIQSGRQYAFEHQAPCPLMYAYYDTEYLGAAHGLSAILQMLLSVPHFLEANPEIEADVRGSINFILSLQLPNGNFPCAMDEVDTPRPESEELVHWCHGAPGVVYLFAKAYLKWNDERYLQACLQCGDLVWRKGLLRKGPGICHGVAGNGYVFLLLYRLTMDPKHLHRALKFASFLFTDEFKKARTPDCPYSLFEGLAGTACFLADLIHLENAHFPFFDVFD